MKFTKYSATFIASLLPFSGLTEEYSAKPQTEVDSIISWLESGESRIALGNWTSIGQTKSNDRLIFNRVDGGNTVAYSNNYIEANYLSPI